jgi:hypothetical protein
MSFAHIQQETLCKLGLRVALTANYCQYCPNIVAHLYEHNQNTTQSCSNHTHHSSTLATTLWQETVVQKPWGCTCAITPVMHAAAPPLHTPCCQGMQSSSTLPHPRTHPKSRHMRHAVDTGSELRLSSLCEEQQRLNKGLFESQACLSADAAWCTVCPADSCQ